MLVVHPRPEGPVMGNGVIATQFGGFDDECKVKWRRVESDLVGFNFARQLGEDMVNLIARLKQQPGSPC